MVGKCRDHIDIVLIETVLNILCRVKYPYDLFMRDKGYAQERSEPYSILFHMSCSAVRCDFIDEEHFFRFYHKFSKTVFTVRSDNRDLIFGNVVHSHRLVLPVSFVFYVADHFQPGTLCSTDFPRHVRDGVHKIFEIKHLSDKPAQVMKRTQFRLFALVDFGGWKVKQRADKCHSEIDSAANAVEKDEPLGRGTEEHDRLVQECSICEKETQDDEGDKENGTVDDAVNLLPAGKKHNPTLPERNNDDHNNRGHKKGGTDKAELIGPDRKHEDRAPDECCQIDDEIPFCTLLPLMEHKTADSHERDNGGNTHSHARKCSKEHGQGIERH